MDSSASPASDFPSRVMDLGAEFTSRFGDCWSMVAPEEDPRDAWDYEPEGEGIHLQIGGKRSFVPDLGEVLWELPEEVVARARFTARIYEISGGRQIGYVRVPRYIYSRSAVSDFADVITRFENTTSALVFDQVFHGGGSMFQMHAMLSYLAERPLALPTHELKLTEDDINSASETVALAEAGEAVSPELVAYSRFLLTEVQAGRGIGGTLTNRVHLSGVAEITPADSHYTKKIVVLIDEVTFSAAEFLAAILQDNGRALLFGLTTAGAGGCVRAFHVGKLAPMVITLTWTVGWRTNGQMIQDVGVHPDITCAPTQEDVLTGYAQYRDALLAAIDTLVPAPREP